METRSNGQLGQFRRPRRRVRSAVVLGAGGVLGGCWSIGAMQALREDTGFDPRSADVLVGTSVGSLLAIMLSAGVSTDDLVADQYGLPTESALADSGFDHDTALRAGFTVSSPPLGSPKLLARALLNPWQYSPATWLAALCPTGQGSLSRIRELIEHMLTHGGWPPSAHVVATDYDTGNRTVFSGTAFCSPQYPETLVEDAVVASCSIPGWFPPVRIGDHRFVDGSVSSVTNADLLVDLEPDEVYILAPMAARSFERPTSSGGLVQRAIRTTFNRALNHEVQVLHQSGVRVHVMAPGPEELARMGVNLMDTSRRLEVLDSAMRSMRDVLQDSA